MSIDLNADLGEGVMPGSNDEAMLDLVTSASIACGFHAGDPTTMRRTLEAAVARGVVVGAHPSYADREGFGRRSQPLTPQEIRDVVDYQVGALEALARAAGTRVRFVKPHGALYNRMAVEEDCARAIAEVVRAWPDMILLAPAGSVATEVARRAGTVVATEVFADRAYLPDGTLAPRGVRGGLIDDTGEVASRAVSLAREQRVTALDGTSIALSGSSICIHGDTPGAVEMAEAVRSALAEAGITIAPFAP